MFRWMHSIGVVLIFIAGALLIVTTVSSPVVKDLAILKVALTNSSTVTFGSFGYCLHNVAPDHSDLCSPRMVGYNAIDVIATLDQWPSDDVSSSPFDPFLTRALVLHPIAAAFAFLAGLVAMGGYFGSAAGMLIALVTWFMTIALVAIDFALFGGGLNGGSSDGSGSVATYDTCIWTTVAAMVLLLLGTFLIFLTCCTDRRKKRAARYSEPPCQSRWRRNKL